MGFSFNERKAALLGFRILPDGTAVNKNGRVMLGSTNCRGYRCVAFRAGSRIVKVAFHRLQAYQLFGEDIFNEGIDVRHLNGIKFDNSAVNIAIGTKSENMMDKPLSDRIRCSEIATSYVRKYNKETVRDFYYANSGSYKLTMLEFNISSKGTLHFIINGHHKH